MPGRPKNPLEDSEFIVRDYNKDLDDHKEIHASHGGREDDYSGFVCAACRRALKSNEACTCGDDE